MPGANLPFDDGLYALLRSLGQRISALETQQNWGIRDGNGVQRIRAGLQEDGTFGIKEFDATGVVDVVLGEQSDGSPGLSVLGPNGAMQRVGGWGYSFAPASFSTSSNSWVTASDDATVTVDIGPSGLAVVLFAAFVTPGSNPAGESAEMGVSIDSGAPGGNPSLLVEVGASYGLGSAASFFYVQSGLSAGAHTFHPEYWVSTAGVTGTFSNRSMVVQPL